MEEVPMSTLSAANIPVWARAATFLIASLGAYALVVRPRIVRWGATDEDVRRPYPGAEIIPGASRASATMAVTIEAPPSKVWPWLVQMGYDRAGWYSWDHLDNWGVPSAERIHREWQDISVGDHLPAVPDGSQWWEVAALDPERFLGLRMSLDLRGRPFDPKGPRPHFHTDSLWGFLLEELPGSRTRLIVGGYWAFEPRWLQPAATVLLYEWTHWIMQKRQFENLKRRVEAAAVQADTAGIQTLVASDARADRVASVVGANM
jgi:proline iminopeptidase